MRKFVLILFVYLSSPVFAQSEEGKPLYSQTIIDTLKHQESLFADFIDDLGLSRKSCGLNQLKIVWGLQVGLCAESNLAPVEFQDKLEGFLVNSDENFSPNQETGKIVNWQSSVNGQYDMGGIITKSAVYGFMYVPKSDGNAFIILNYSLIGASVEIVADPNALTNYLEQRNLSTVKSFVPVVVETFWYYFGATETDCGVSIDLGDLGTGSPFCASVVWTQKEFMDGVKDFADRLDFVLQFPDQFEQFGGVGVRESHYTLLDDGVYIPFYFQRPKNEYRYILRFVEGKNENMIVIYPPKFE